LSAFLCGLVLLVSVAGSARAEQAKKKDVVYLVNGDRISGEITRLQGGILHIKTEMAGNIQVKWSNVERLEGGTVLQVTLNDESSYQGTLEKEASGEGAIAIRTADEMVRIDADRLELAETLNKPPVDRFKGGVSFGLSILKAKDKRQLSLGLNGSYTADSYYAEASYNTFYTNDSVAGSNYRDYLNTSYQRKLPRDWFFTGMFNTARNDALELDIRYNFNGAVGKDIISTESTTLQALGGVGVVREKYESGEDHSDFETVLGLKLKAMELDSPKLSLNGEALFYPRPGDINRFRIETRTGLNLMLMKNVFWGLTFFDSYNSKPPSAGAVKNDYGLVSSLGVNW